MPEIFRLTLYISVIMIPKLCHCIHKRSPLDPMWSQLSPVHNITPCFFKIKFYARSKSFAANLRLLSSPCLVLRPSVCNNWRTSWTNFRSIWHCGEFLKFSTLLNVPCALYITPYMRLSWITSAVVTGSKVISQTLVITGPMSGPKFKVVSHWPKNVIHRPKIIWSQVQAYSFFIEPLWRTPGQRSLDSDPRSLVPDPSFYNAESLVQFHWSQIQSQYAYTESH